MLYEHFIWLYHEKDVLDGCCDVKMYVACQLELANHYLLAYFAFLETTKLDFRIRHVSSVCVCVRACRRFQILNMLTDFHNPSYKFPF